MCAHRRKVSAHHFDPGLPFRVWGLDPRYLTCPLIPVLSLDPRSTVFPVVALPVWSKIMIPRSCKLLALRSEILIVLELVLVLGLFIIDARHAVSPIRFPRSPIRRSADPFLLAWIRIPSNCPKGLARSFQPRVPVPDPEAYVLCQELLTDPFLGFPDEPCGKKGRVKSHRRSECQTLNSANCRCQLPFTSHLSPLTSHLSSSPTRRSADPFLPATSSGSGVRRRTSFVKNC